MPIQNRQYVYPEFVDQIYKELSVKVAEMIVKNVIMTHVEKKNENEFKISKTTQDMSNHCETQDLKGSISALSIFTIFYASEIGVKIENLNNTEDEVKRIYEEMSKNEINHETNNFRTNTI